MKKCVFLAGLVLWLARASLCPAEASQLEVRDDQYGGTLYSYLDHNGNKHVTNSPDYLPGTVISALKDEPAETHETRPLLVLASRDKQSGSMENEDGDGDDYLDDYDYDQEYDSLADPFEPINRLFFHFNDKLYFFFLKPVGTVYREALPSPVRESIGNFFENIIYPVRFVSCLLQGKVEGAFVETGRFITNSTLGLAGLFDPATELLELKKYDEDLGQVFGAWGVGHGFFLNLPFLGPSSLRDGLGLVGDNYLDPMRYLCSDFWDRAALRGTEAINSTSFRIGDYEALKRAALDPYIAMKDGYVQLRAKKVAE